MYVFPLPTAPLESWWLDIYQHTTVVVLTTPLPLQFFPWFQDTQLSFKDIFRLHEVEKGWAISYLSQTLAVQLQAPSLGAYSRTGQGVSSLHLLNSQDTHCCSPPMTALESSGASPIRRGTCFSLFSQSCDIRSRISLFLLKTHSLEEKIFLFYWCKVCKTRDLNIQTLQDYYFCFLISVLSVTLFLLSL